MNKKTLDTQIGPRLKFFRSRSGKSQFDVEVELDMSPGNLSRIENGHINPTKETVYRIAAVYGLSNNERSYLIGPFATPPTEVEIQEVQKIIHSHFEKKTTLAYATDERYRLISVSKGFRNMMGISDKTYQSILNRSFIEVILDKKIGVLDRLAKDSLTQTLENVLGVFYQDAGFFIDDSLVQDAISAIEHNTLTKEVWDRVKSNNHIPYFNQDRSITFDLPLNLKVSLTYSDEPIRKHERFTVTEYSTNNSILRFLLSI